MDSVLPDPSFYDVVNAWGLNNTWNGKYALADGTASAGQPPRFIRMTTGSADMAGDGFFFGSVTYC